MLRAADCPRLRRQLHGRQRRVSEQGASGDAIRIARRAFRLCAPQGVREHRGPRGDCDRALRGMLLPTNLGIAVNVHASTLGRDAAFVDFLAASASQCGIELSRLTVEVVEHSPVWNATEFLHSLRLLRELGVRIALDDVGTGQSNYRMILDAEPDCFKIDSYLVQTAHADNRRRSMLASIMKLARDLGSAVVAEGVEAPEDLEVVLNLGITLIRDTSSAGHCRCQHCRR